MPFAVGEGFEVEGLEGLDKFLRDSSLGCYGWGLPAVVTAVAYLFAGKAVGEVAVEYLLGDDFVLLDVPSPRQLGPDDLRHRGVGIAGLASIKIAAIPEDVPVQRPDAE